MENSAAAGAMERSVFREIAFEVGEFEEVNKAEDLETTNSRSEEPLGTMEGNQAEFFVDDGEQLKENVDDGEQLKENICCFPEIDWDALSQNLRLDLGDDEDWDAIQASLAQMREREREKKPRALGRKETTRERRLRMEEPEERMAEEREDVLEKADPEEIAQDFLVALWEGGKYRDDWNAIWSRTCGSYEDTTRIPAMRYTHKQPPELGVHAYNTLQVFSVKVASTRGGLKWPLDVFGFVAMRDTLDYNRNIIFNRTRESCQTLTEEDHNLVLVGPSRAIFVSGPHPLNVEVELKVKGTTESEDKELSVLAVPLMCTLSYSSLIPCSYTTYTTKLSTIQFTLGHLASSVEATIFVQVIRGSWPDGFSCEFSAFVRCKNVGPDKNNAAADIEREKIVLFNSRGEKGIVDNDGNIKLSRRVVTVETRGELKVSFKAWKVGSDAMEEEKVYFTPSRAGVSYREIDVGFCAMEVSVAWSLISGSPVTADELVL